VPPLTAKARLFGAPFDLGRTGESTKQLLHFIFNTSRTVDFGTLLIRRRGPAAARLRAPGGSLAIRRENRTPGFFAENLWPASLIALEVFGAAFATLAPCCDFA